MTRAREPLSDIAVVGSGQVALLAAAALARALPAARIVRVSLPENPAALADTAHTTLPSLARLHARIGVDEPGMFRRAHATHRLATRYHGWRADGAVFLVGFGATAPAVAGGFARGDGGGGPLEAGAPALAAALAEEDRFARPSDDRGSPLSDLDYALRFSPAGHAARLRSLATHLGVIDMAAPSIRVERDAAGAILALAFEDGRTLAADLYIDASGPEAVLRAPSAPVVDWSRTLAADRLLYAAATAPALSVRDEVAALDDGYLMRSSGRDASRACLVYAAALTTPEEAAAVLKGADEQPATFIALSPGRPLEAWAANAVAIGDAAASFEPLGATNLHLAVRQIELLLDLLPGRSIAAVERAEYNRRASNLADRTRDFVAAHHAAGGGGRYARHAATLDRSVALRRTLDFVARRGRFAIEEDESVGRDLWMQLIAGVGAPVAPEPRLLAMPADGRRRAVDAQRARIAAGRAAAQPYAAWLRRELGDAR